MLKEFFKGFKELPLTKKIGKKNDWKKFYEYHIPTEPMFVLCVTAVFILGSTIFLLNNLTVAGIATFFSGAVVIHFVAIPSGKVKESKKSKNAECIEKEIDEISRKLEANTHFTKLGTHPEIGKNILKEKECLEKQLREKQDELDKLKG